MFGGQYKGKRVFLTGHTGFKGSWLCQWLLDLGAEVTGFSDRVFSPPSAFSEMRLSSGGHAGNFRHVLGDVRDLAAVSAAMTECAPDFVFHLAAQALVRSSYSTPVETFDVNVMGTVNVLEAVRQLTRPVVVVVVTSDKCYENREWVHSYREEDPMGGHDPYSASKGAAELIVSSYRRSFFGDRSSALVASVRAGNVIGGGDWAEDRIMPDCIRALKNGQPIRVRRPRAVRPWQHVLEPLSGYLWLGAQLASGLRHLAGGYNFGPGIRSNRNVEALVAEVLTHWAGEWLNESNPADLHEATLLNLSIDKAAHHLGWHPVWTFEQAVGATVAWYRDVVSGATGGDIRTREDIASYCREASEQGLAWTRQ